MSSYHPESWNPVWKLSTMLSALLSFMVCSVSAHISLVFLCAMLPPIVPLFLVLFVLLQSPTHRPTFFNLWIIVSHTCTYTRAFSFSVRTQLQWAQLNLLTLKNEPSQQTLVLTMRKILNLETCSRSLFTPMLKISLQRTVGMWSRKAGSNSNCSHLN